MVQYITSFTTFFTGGSAGGGAFYGQGSGLIWLDQVRCQGYESRLFDCPSNSLGVEDCTHAEDASTFCSTSETNFVSSGIARAASIISIL